MNKNNEDSFLADFGWDQSALNRFIQATYDKENDAQEKDAKPEPKFHQCPSVNSEMPVNRYWKPLETEKIPIYKKIHLALQGQLKRFGVHVPDFDQSRVFTLDMGSGFYQSDSGRIVANSEDVYGHEALHWASVHYDRGVPGDRLHPRNEAGPRFFDGADDTVGRKVQWLEEALVSEMDQRVRMDAGELSVANTIYHEPSEAEKNVLSDYIIGKDAPLRRVGDFSGSVSYSVTYGRLLRSFVPFLLHELKLNSPDLTEDLVLDLLWTNTFVIDQQKKSSEIIMEILEKRGIKEKFFELTEKISHMPTDTILRALDDTASRLDLGVSTYVKDAVDELDQLFKSLT